MTTTYVEILRRESVCRFPFPFNRFRLEFSFLGPAFLTQRNSLKDPYPLSIPIYPKFQFAALALDQFVVHFRDS